MMVLRSKSRPTAPPPKRDPYAGHMRQLLGVAKNRRGPVTLATVRGLAGDRDGGGDQR
ncbi:hypothetical protein [Methylobacterium pseudosasicola]|uniref:Uncharacterized protein n=1 Tax=Methylobacterium pseudosasicola TaxID=582667 RepID=A0A1I4V7U9_9HYPH|nr:hypothetical protein [Methylobacterium pseudosasicola]SFM97228.1 hypothetical protein SAMN05192568_108916 [Methylobacterium pseudosasicola]